MEGIRRFLVRIATSFRGNYAERDLARQVAAHLQLLEDKFLAQGMSLDEARLSARRAFGGIDQAKESHRDARSFRWLADAPKDAAYALRSLSVRPPSRSRPC